MNSFKNKPHIFYVFLSFITFNLSYTRESVKSIHLDDSYKNIQIGATISGKFFCLEVLPPESSISESLFFNVCNKSYKNQRYDLIQSNNFSVFKIVPRGNDRIFRINKMDSTSPLIDFWFLQWTDDEFIIKKELEEVCLKRTVSRSFDIADYSSCTLTTISYDSTFLFRLSKNGFDMITKIKLPRNSIGGDFSEYKPYYMRFTETWEPYNSYYFEINYTDFIVEPVLPIGEYALSFPNYATNFKTIKLNTPNTGASILLNEHYFNIALNISVDKFQKSYFFSKICMRCNFKESPKIQILTNNLDDLKKMFIYCRRGSAINSVAKKCFGLLCDFKYRCLENSNITSKCRVVQSDIIADSNYFSLGNKSIFCNENEVMQWIKFDDLSGNYRFSAQCCKAKNILKFDYYYFHVPNFGRFKLNENLFNEFSNIGENMAISAFKIVVSLVNSYYYFYYEIRTIIFKSADIENSYPIKRKTSVTMPNSPFDSILDLDQIQISCLDNEAISDLTFKVENNIFIFDYSCLKSNLITKNCQDISLSNPKTYDLSQKVKNLEGLISLFCSETKVLNKFRFDKVGTNKMNYSITCCDADVKSKNRRDFYFFDYSFSPNNLYTDIVQYKFFLGVNEVLNGIRFYIDSNTITADYIVLTLD
jgi:hypothetical protein